MSERKNAPVQMPHHGRVPHGIRFRIPWRIHKKAWEQYDKIYHCGQSAERLAERGGFALEELIYLLAGETMVNDDDRMATNFFNIYEDE